MARRRMVVAGAALLVLAVVGPVGCAGTYPFGGETFVSPVTVAVTATPGHGEAQGAVQVAVDRVSVLTHTVVVSFTVTGSGPQALLFDAPVLSAAEGRRPELAEGPVLEGEPPTPDSLEAAHLALLDLVTRGEATAALEFPRPGGEPPWVLVFDPLHEPGDYVAPRVEVEVRP